MKTKQIRRPFKVYVMHTAWVFMTVFYATNSASELGRWTWIGMACLGTVSLISMVRSRSYFEIKNDQLIVNRDFFRTETIALSTIERVKLEPGPFTSSKIVLKDKTSIKYTDSHAPDNEVKALFGQFNIRVE